MVPVSVILEALAAVAGAYQLFATAVCLAFRRGQGPAARRETRGVSILKPVHGADSALRDAIRSHTVLEGEYELLCGVREGDPAAAVIAEFPRARLIPCSTVTPNRKVGSLIDL